MDFPIFDGHNDSLSRLSPYTPEKIAGFFAGNTRGHLDLPRARAGGMGGGLFSLYVPADPALAEDRKTEIVRMPDGSDVRLAAALDPAYALQAALAMLAGVFRLEAAAKGQVRVARTIADLRACLQAGALAWVIHFEGADAIDPQLNALEVFHQAGLRSLGIVWSRPTVFGHGVPFCHPHTPDTGPGLTDAGRALVRECNRLGIMLDVSHLNEKGFWDLAEVTDAPIVATHSAVHAICPAARNLTDRQLDAIRASDGLVGLNLEVTTLRPDGQDDPDTPLELIVRHMDYLVEHLGIDRVGLGSDFDGGTMPLALGDAAGLPKVLMQLRQHGYDEAALRKLAFENWLRVLERTWRE